MTAEPRTNPTVASSTDGSESGIDAIRLLTQAFNGLLDSMRANPLLTPPLSPKNVEVALAYQGYRQGLGRAGVSVLVRVERDPKAADVIDLYGPFPDTPLTIVAFNADGTEIGRDAEHTRVGENRKATIPGLKPHQLVARVEVLDEHNVPILFGGTIPPVSPTTASRSK
jgi:hypothetical protein